MQNSNSDGAGYENAILNGQMAKKGGGGSGTKKVISCYHADKYHVKRHAIFFYTAAGAWSRMLSSNARECTAMFQTWVRQT